MGTEGRKIAIYLLAGVATAPLFMEGLRQTLAARFEQQGWQVRSELLYPYGDWSRSLSIQLGEMAHDLWRSHSRPLRSIGGRRAAAAIQESCGDDAVPLLIGHSGGGVAAVHAVQILAAAGSPAPVGGGRADGPLLPHRIVQIGSPKCPIPEWLRESVLYAGSLNAKGRPSDPITRLGSWGGWLRRARSSPTQRDAQRRWIRKPFSPSAIVHFPVIGGHPDYFREHGPYLNNEGISNMETTVRAIWDWFHSTPH